MSISKEPIVIALADDNYIYRVGMKRELKKYPQVRLLFEAESGQELLDKLTIQRPHIVLTDILMPLMNGVDATREIKKLYPTLLVAGLSEVHDNPYVPEFIEVGGNAYFTKEALHVNFIESLYELLHKGYLFNNTFKREDVEASLQRQGKSLKFRDGKRFTEKEVMVMRLISEHKTITNIAEELNLSIDSIKKYKAGIHAKLGTKMDSEIMAYAVKVGFADM